MMLKKAVAIRFLPLDKGSGLAARIGQVDQVDLTSRARLELAPDLYPECENRTLLRSLLRTRSTRPTPDRTGEASPGRWLRVSA